MSKKAAKIETVMTTNVKTIRPDDTMVAVAHLFEKNAFHHLPVVDNNKKVVGILSKSEYYRLQHSFTAFNAKSAFDFNEEVFDSILVEEVMIERVAKLFPDDTVEQAMGYFRENLFHAAPVVNRETKELEGIVTTFDLLNFFAKED